MKTNISLLAALAALSMGITLNAMQQHPGDTTQQPCAEKQTAFSEQFVSQYMRNENLNPLPLQLKLKVIHPDFIVAMPIYGLHMPLITIAAFYGNDEVIQALKLHDVDLTAQTEAMPGGKKSSNPALQPGFMAWQIAQRQGYTFALKPWDPENRKSWDTISNASAEESSPELESPEHGESRSPSHWSSWDA